jgi:hypothetical protein
MVHMPEEGAYLHKTCAGTLVPVTMPFEQLASVATWI